MITITGRITGLAILRLAQNVREGIPDARCAAVHFPRALNLVRGGRPCKMCRNSSPFPANGSGSPLLQASDNGMHIVLKHADVGPHIELLAIRTLVQLTLTSQSIGKQFSSDDRP